MENPLILDPSGRQRLEEEEVLHRTAGPVLVDVLGEKAWAIGHHDLLTQLLSDSRVSKDPRQHWPRFIDGEIVGKWPLYLQVSVDNMFTAYGKDHRRLRRLVSPAFSGRRTAQLLPSIASSTDLLLDSISASGADIVDLRQSFAAQLPVAVISDLLGIPASLRTGFRESIDRIWDTTNTADQAVQATQDAYAMLHEFVALKRAEPADDLTSALIAARDDEGDGSVLTETELTDTLLLVIAAGYETTINLLDSAVTALLADPGQLDLVRSGTVGWEDVVEETLRFASPVSQMPMRYAVEDIALPDGVTIRKGDAILASYGAAGRDPELHGATGNTFDVTRADKRHVAFGHGVHYCLGAPLARAEAAIALPRLFERFPDLSLAVPAAELEPLPSILGNGHKSLPVRLGVPTR
ncbi:cytochrome P450 family protein [Kribbella speibonae]|uniref:Cytochrome P450 n=1 Tax=Kribbella speibonae TaxID=1572660 RepID=A0ABY2AAU3_9ACTN|nr:cytochrome P450 [Kribbella speibonae]TCC26828.1 cytochrome P450 [Kribbella speibonae]